MPHQLTTEPTVYVTSAFMELVITVNVVIYHVENAQAHKQINV